ncbi:MAG: tRNA1(Val) (adenine(37)-N6)-methyltransferase [Bacillota bacterium]
MFLLKENEKLEDLQINNLKIIQSKYGYRFTSDAVILANIARALPGQKVVDLGSGSGVISILMAAKTKAAKIVGVEIQKRLADMAKRSVEYNKLTERIEIINKPMQNIHKIIGGSFDVVVSNPPYETDLSKDLMDEQSICRRELKVTLEEVIISAEKLLKFGGNFFMINKVTRLADTIYFLKYKNLEPKKLTMIYPKASKGADTFIIEAKKGSKPSMIVSKPFILYNEDGTMTESIRRIYGK